MLSLFILCWLVALFSPIKSLDNGLALTPPMGWLTWERFRCNTDCVQYPDDCISENLIKVMADRMAEDGYLEAGYEYIIIDDCWLAPERDADDRLQPDPDRFPSGIKALADYVHEKGLKFGIYEDYGTKTCAGYPGSLDHLEIDANTFAEWGVDYLKFDGCNVTPDEAMEQGHLEMAKYLNQTGRPIVFSCEFPLYRGSAVIQIIQLPWKLVTSGETNVTLKMIGMSSPLLSSFIKTIKTRSYQSLDQAIGTIPTCWSSEIPVSVMNKASPLIMSVDLRTIEPEYRNILQNKHAITINQDALGIQGHLHTTIDNIDIWMKPILPKIGEDSSYALGFVSNRDDDTSYTLELTLESLHFTQDIAYLIMDAFENTETVARNTDPLEITVNPSGAVLWHVVPNPFKTEE